MSVPAAVHNAMWNVLLFLGDSGAGSVCDPHVAGAQLSQTEIQCREHTPVSIAALLTIADFGKLSQCPSVDE